MNALIGVPPPTHFSPWWNHKPTEGEIKVEKVGDVYRIDESLKSSTVVNGMDDLVKNGTVRSWARTDNGLVAYADSADAADKIRALPKGTTQVDNGSLLDRARQLLLPPDLAHTVAPEYIKFRLWSLAGTVLIGALNFMGASLTLDAQKVVFSAGEKYATAQFVQGLMCKGVSMASSYMANKGDTNPRKWMMAAALVNSCNAVFNVAMLSTIPKSYIFVSATMGATSSVGNTLGGAANVNVFNHIAKGDSRGLVQAKNSNQDMFADAMGAPLALGLMGAANALHVSPYLVCAGILGPALVFCNLQAARCLHMEPLNQSFLENIADGVIDTGDVIDAPQKPMLASFKELFVNPPDHHDPNVHVAASLDEAAQAATAAGYSTDTLFGIFKNDKYVLTETKGGVMLAFQKDASMDDYIRGFTHARLLERVLGSKLPDAVAQVAGNDRTLLLEMTHKALPDNLPNDDELADKGWHTNVKSLGFPTVNGGWSGPDVRRVSKVTMPDILELIEQPDPQRLKQILTPPPPPPPQRARGLFHRLIGKH